MSYLVADAAVGTGAVEPGIEWSEDIVLYTAEAVEVDDDVCLAKTDETIRRNLHRPHSIKAL